MKLPSPTRCEITDGQHTCSAELFEEQTFNVAQALYKNEHKIQFNNPVLIFGAARRKA